MVSTETEQAVRQFLQMWTLVGLLVAIGLVVLAIRGVLRAVGLF